MAGNLPNSSNYEALGEDPFTFKNCRLRLVSRSAGTPGDLFTGSQLGIKEPGLPACGCTIQGSKRAWLCKANDHFPGQGACH